MQGRLTCEPSEPLEPALRCMAARGCAGGRARGGVPAAFLPAAAPPQAAPLSAQPGSARAPACAGRGSAVLQDICGRHEQPPLDLLFISPGCWMYVTHH
jgi:hypothetical protein